jgi:hypothetical protein
MAKKETGKIKKMDTKNLKRVSGGDVLNSGGTSIPLPPTPRR